MVEHVCVFFGISPSCIFEKFQGSRQKFYVSARRVLAHWYYEFCGMKPTEIARLMRMNHTTVHHLLKQKLIPCEVSAIEYLAKRQSNERGWAIIEPRVADKIAAMRDPHPVKVANAVS